jgi:hypothetical protein
LQITSIIFFLKFLRSFLCCNNQEIWASSFVNCNIKINQVLFSPSCFATTKTINEFLVKEKHTKKKHVARLVVRWQRDHYQNGEPQRVGLTKNWWYQGCNDIVDFDEHGLSDLTPISAPSKNSHFGIFWMAWNPTQPQDIVLGS